MTTLEITNYAFLLVLALWSLFMVFNLKKQCKEQCDINEAKKIFASYLFGLVLIVPFFLALKWALTGSVI